MGLGDIKISQTVKIERMRQGMKENKKDKYKYRRLLQGVNKAKKEKEGKLSPQNRLFN